MTPTTTTPPPRRWRARTWSATKVAAFIIAVLALWPTSFGGWTTLSVVSGESMEPTFRHGDLGVAYALPPQVGDVVVYRTPLHDTAIIHRIVGGTPSGWVMRGDNNPGNDPWHPTDEDVVGKVVLRVPAAGWIVGFLAHPLTLVTLAAALVAVLTWPVGKTHPRARGKDAHQQKVPGDG